MRLRRMSQYSLDIDPGTAPHSHAVESFSQPTTGQATKLLTKCRRTVSEGVEQGRITTTSTGSFPDKDFGSLEQLQDAVFRVIVGRLKVHGFVSHLLQMKHFRWCLPLQYEIFFAIRYIRLIFAAWNMQTVGVC